MIHRLRRRAPAAAAAAVVGMAVAVAVPTLGGTPAAGAGSGAVVAPVPGALVTGSPVVTVAFAVPVTAATARVATPGRAATPLPVTVDASGRSGRLTLPPVIPGRRYDVTVQPTTPAGPAAPIVASFRGQARTRSVAIAGTRTRSRVVTGTDPVIGHRGRLFTFTVEVQGSLASQAQPLADEVQRVLADPARGWTARGKYRLQRVDDPRWADIRLLVARPGVVDQLCARAGLYTGGDVSCWNHQFAALNANRWTTGALSGGFRSLAHYRTYLISHEFGHGLHLHHRSCPRRGALAPVMQQQTGGQDGCRANGWPYP